MALRLNQNQRTSRNQSQVAGNGDVLCGLAQEHCANNKENWQKEKHLGTTAPETENQPGTRRPKHYARDANNKQQTKSKTTCKGE
jgi:hypothetical protein